MELWTNGKINKLLVEGHSIQQRLYTAKQSSHTDSRLACSFSNLIFQGKTKAAICLITENNRGCVLLPDDLVSPETPDSPTVLESLKSEHPPVQPCVADAVISLRSDPLAMHPVIYEGLDTHCI